MASFTVKSARGLYPVVIGQKLTPRLKSLIKQSKADRVFVVLDANFYALHGERFLKQLGKRVTPLVVASGEKNKTQRAVSAIHDFLLDNGVSRTDLLLACGGGVTTDLAGYAAATVLRGIRWGAVPTTLLGMVDASIGGKTGVNHRNGKNLIGAFWAPEFVCADIEYLATLEIRHMRAGFGEILKCAGLAGGALLRDSKKYLSDISAAAMPITPLLERLIAQSAAFKGAIVSRDEREAGVRTHMNLGHTVGHGIEQALKYRGLLHGEAVGLGLAATLELGERCGFRTQRLKEYGALVDTYLRSLPRRKLQPERILAAMSLDKKRQGRRMRFVLLRDVGKPIIEDSINPRMIRTAIDGMIERYRG